MKTLLILMLGLVLSTELLQAQDNEHYVTAISGLRMRSGPSLSDAKIRTLPFESIVSIIGAREGDYFEVDKIEGRMVPIRYIEEGKNIEGYVFDGFLADENPKKHEKITEEVLLIRQRTEAEWEAISQQVSEQDMAEIGSDAGFYASEGTHVINQREGLNVVNSEARFFLFEGSNGKKYFFDSDKHGGAMIIFFRPDKAPVLTDFMSIMVKPESLDYFDK